MSDSKTSSSSDELEYHTSEQWIEREITSVAALNKAACKRGELRLAPPLKRPRLALRSYETDCNDPKKKNERVIGLSEPLTNSPYDAPIFEPQSFGMVPCTACILRMGKMREYQTRDYGVTGAGKNDKCFVCKLSGHWGNRCTLTCGDLLYYTHGAKDAAERTACMHTLGLWWSARSLMWCEELSHEPDHDPPHAGTKRKIFELPVPPQPLPSLRSLAAKALARHISKTGCERVLGQAILPSTLVMSELVPRLSFRMLDALFYKDLPGLSGGVTSEVHAVAMRRAFASARHFMTICPSSQVKELEHIYPNIFPRDVFDTWTGDYMHGLKSGTRPVYTQFEKTAIMLYAYPSVDVSEWLHAHDEYDALCRFERFSRGLITREHIAAWDNYAVVAGGAAVGALTSFRKHSDIDIFILNRNDKTADDYVAPNCVATHIMATIVRAFFAHLAAQPEESGGQKDRDAHYSIMRRKMRFRYGDSPVATMLFEGDFPDVQVILSTCINTAELLASFDIDCAGVAITSGPDLRRPLTAGKKCRFVASPRAFRALALGYNIFDPCIARSTTYLDRLEKYSHADCSPEDFYGPPGRGFDVLLPAGAQHLEPEPGSPRGVTSLLAGFVDLGGSYHSPDVTTTVPPAYASLPVPKGWKTLKDLQASMVVHFEGSYSKFVKNVEVRKLSNELLSTHGLRCNGDTMLEPCTRTTLEPCKRDSSSSSSSSGGSPPDKSSSRGKEDSLERAMHSPVFHYFRGDECAVDVHPCAMPVKYLKVAEQTHPLLTPILFPCEDIILNEMDKVRKWQTYADRTRGLKEILDQAESLIVSGNLEEARKLLSDAEPGFATLCRAYRNNREKRALYDRYKDALEELEAPLR